MLKRVLFLSIAVCANIVISGWQRTYGGTQNDFGKCIILAIDDGYIVVGYTYSFGIGTPSYPNAYILKLNDDGDTAWTKVYGDARGEWLNSVTAIDDGYIAVGYESALGGGENLYIIRFNSDGDSLWTKRYSLGNYQEANCVVRIVPSNEIIIVGYTDITSHDVWVLCINTDGDTLWSRTFGDDQWDVGLGAVQVSDDEFMVVGYKGLSYTDEDFWVIKMRTNGDTLWTQTFGGPSWDEAYSITATRDGYVIAGETFSFGAGSRDAWIVKINTDGETIWTKPYGSTSLDGAKAIITTQNDDIAIAGYTTQGTSADAFLMKVSGDDGSERWVHLYGGSGSDEAVSMCPTRNNDGFLLIGNTTSSGSGGNDIFIVRTDSLGNASVSETQSGHQKANEILFDVLPNPFNKVCNFEVKMPFTEQEVNLKIFDTNGNLVYSANTNERNQFIWQPGDNLTSGVYFVELFTKKARGMKKVVFLK